MVRPRVEHLRNTEAFTRSSAARAALKYAMGESALTFADLDDEAHRLEQMVVVAQHYKGRVKSGPARRIIAILLTGNAVELEAYLAARV